MFHKDLEDILKKKFEAEYTEVDHDALWSRVYPEIKKDKKRPTWIVFLGLGLMFLGVAIGWMLNADYFDKGEYLEDISSVQKRVDLDKVETIVDDSFVIETGDDSKLESQTELLGNRTSNVNTSNLESSQDIANVKTLGVNTSIQKVWRNIATKAIAKSNILKIESLKPLINNVVTAETREALTLFPIDVLEFKSLSLNREMKSFAVSSIREKTASRKYANWSFEALLGYGLTDRTLNLNDGSSSFDLEWRNQHEESLDALSFDLLTGYQFARHWNVRVGLDYQMITDRTMHNYDLTETIPANNALGLELLRTNFTETKYNYFHSIGIPIQGAYLLGNNGFGLEIGAGVRLSKMFLAKGIVHTELETYDLDMDRENRYGRTVNVDILADIGLYLSISKNIHWTTRFQYQYGLNGINTPINPIEQKYNLLKIKTGLSYQF